MLVTITVKPGQVYPQDSINEVESVGSWGFQIHLCILACVMSREVTCDTGLYKISTSSVSLNLMLMSSKKFNPFKDFQYDQIQKSSRKIFSARYECRNADLNLTPVTGTTNWFIFQRINQFFINRILDGIPLTCLDCKA